MSLDTVIAEAVQYADEQGLELPASLRLRAIHVGAIKAGGSLGEIQARYHDRITQALIEYFEGGTVAASRNAFRRAAVEAIGGAFDLGWQDGGRELPPDSDALEWLNARVEEELAYIGQVFVDAKGLRRDKEFDYFAYITARADGYVQTVVSAYNRGKLFAVNNKMLTFVGDDGSAEHVCQSIGGTCVRLKGQRHRASWWIDHDLVPYPGNRNYDCGGWNCRHYLEDDDGNRFTL